MIIPLRGNECIQCHDRLETGHFVQVMERKKGVETGRTLQLCNSCYKIFLSLELKDLPIKNDIKANIERWKKEVPTLN
jgi:hypothetical protein